MKLIILIRKDLKMSFGKIISQVSHGLIELLKKGNKKKIKKWRFTGEKIISLSVFSEKELLNINKECKNNNVYTNIISDMGLTEVKYDSKTVCIIGPDIDGIIDKHTKHLQLY